MFMIEQTKLWAQQIALTLGTTALLVKLGFISHFGYVSESLGHLGPQRDSPILTEITFLWASYAWKFGVAESIGLFEVVRAVGSLPGTPCP